jgi:hypothetical protein
VRTACRLSPPDYLDHPERRTRRLCCQCREAVYDAGGQKGSKGSTAVVESVKWRSTFDLKASLDFHFKTSKTCCQLLLAFALGWPYGHSGTALADAVLATSDPSSCKTGAMNCPTVPVTRSDQYSSHLSVFGIHTQTILHTDPFSARLTALQASTSPLLRRTIRLRRGCAMTSVSSFSVLSQSIALSARFQQLQTPISAFTVVLER